MKISIITVVYNNCSTIRQCIDSVLSQNYPDLEYIVVDGASTDGTTDIIRSYGNRISRFISEPDKGIYDAMNKGLALASGEVVGILNSDDFYASVDVLAAVARFFEESKADAVSTDVAIYRDERFDKAWRYYRCRSWKPWMFRIGWQPPHPGFFLKNECYRKFGVFDTQFRISADFDLLLRMILKHRIRVSFHSFLSVKMRDGGASAGLKNMSKANREDHISLRKNGYFSWLPLIWLKYVFKVFQLFFR